jgi:type IV secretory pathway VirB3-like protein
VAIINRIVVAAQQLFNLPLNALRSTEFFRGRDYWSTISPSVPFCDFLWLLIRIVVVATQQLFNLPLKSLKTTEFFHDRD